MQPPKPRTRWTLAIVSLALFMVVLDNLIVTVALPSIHDGPRRDASSSSSGPSTPTRSPSPSP